MADPRLLSGHKPGSRLLDLLDGRHAEEPFELRLNCDGLSAVSA
jgi:hypothetical protein